MSIEKKKPALNAVDQAPSHLVETIQLLSGKWKLLIVRFLLRHGKTRFSGFQRALPGITPRGLSSELSALQQHSLVKRIVVDSKPLYVEYELTRHGKTLEPLIASIDHWGELHRAYLP